MTLPFMRIKDPGKQTRAPCPIRCPWLCKAPQSVTCFTIRPGSMRSGQRQAVLPGTGRAAGCAHSACPSAASPAHPCLLAVYSWHRVSLLNINQKLTRCTLRRVDFPVRTACSAAGNRAASWVFLQKLENTLGDMRTRCMPWAVTSLYRHRQWRRRENSAKEITQRGNTEPLRTELSTALGPAGKRALSTVSGKGRPAQGEKLLFPQCQVGQKREGEKRRQEMEAGFSGHSWLKLRSQWRAKYSKCKRKTGHGTK